MTKLLSVLSLVTLFISSAYADYNIVNCDSISGTDHVLTLIIVNKDVKQVRVQTTGNRARPFIPTKILNQPKVESTLYSLGGYPELMEVENEVLEGNGGLVKLARDEFSCL